MELATCLQRDLCRCRRHLKEVTRIHAGHELIDQGAALERIGRFKCFAEQLAAITRRCGPDLLPKPCERGIGHGGRFAIRESPAGPATLRAII